MSKTACVILNYNDYPTTVELIKLIKDYDSLDYIVVVDNNSTDNSPQVLKEYESSRLYFLETNYNGGYGYGNNAGIVFSKHNLNCDYCLVANPDVIFSNSFVESMINYLDKDPDCALVSGMQEGPGASAWKETDVLGDLCFNNMLLNRLFKPRYYPNSYFNKEVVDVYAIPGCLFLARLDAFFEIGLYDEDFFLFEEEKVISFKLKELGWTSKLLTNQNYIHNHSVTINKNIRGLGQAKRLVLNSNLLYLKKYQKLTDLQLLFVSFYHRICIIENILYGLYKRLTNE